MPWIVGLGFVVAVGAVALLNLRFLRRLWDKTHGGGESMDDDWDPFR
jgi:hypothetical protein